MLYLDLDKKMIGGIASVRDIKEKGLIKASIKNQDKGKGGRKIVCMIK